MILRSLVIYDVSSVVYAGTESRYGSDYFSKDNSNNRLKGLPVGGIKRILNNALMRIHDKDVVLFCFDSRTERKQLSSMYKSQRKFNPDVAIQREMLLEICDRVGIPYLKIDGYEADDLISAVVHQHCMEFSDIEIITGDTDIASNLLNERIHITGAAAIYPSITVSDYPYAISKTHTIEYNQILPYYFCFGKPSNNVPPLCSSTADCQAVYNRFVEFCNTNNIAPAYRSEMYTFAQWLLDSVEQGVLTDSQVSEYYNRALLVYPKDVEDTSQISFSLAGPEALNISELKKVLKVYELYRIANIFRFDDVSSISPIPRDSLNNLMRWKTIYEGGGYLVDQDISPDISQFVNKTTRFTENVGDF